MRSYFVRSLTASHVRQREHLEQTKSSDTRILKFLSDKDAYSKLKKQTTDDAKISAKKCVGKDDKS